MKKYVLLVFLIFQTIIFASDFPRTMFVENNLARTLSTMNLETGEITNDVLELGQTPNQILSYRDKLYALNSIPAEIMVIDPQSLDILDRINLPENSNPYWMGLVGTNRMYVSLLMADAVAVVDLETKAVTKTIDVGIAPQGLLVDNNTVVVTNTGGYPDYAGSSVSVIDATADSVTLTIPVPTNPQSVQWGPDYNYHIICSGKWGENQGQIVTLNMFAPPAYTPAITDTFIVGGFPGHFDILPNGMIYIADWGDTENGFMYKIDLFSKTVVNNFENPIRVGKGAMRVFVDKATDDLYVSNFDDDTVQKINTTDDSVVETFAFGDGAQDMIVVEPVTESDPWADEVVAFVSGDSWNGFGLDFFPLNVLGPPDPDAAINELFASGSESELLSLGHGGEIVLKFSDNVVVNGDGVDFLVFENVFTNTWTGEPFMEAGKVAVSQDGVTFVEFPWDTTGTGLAGVTAVKSTQDPTNPEASGADGFDLDTVGLDWIRYVKITDIGDEWLEGEYNGDFDLDAIVAVNSQPEEPTSVDRKEMVADNFRLEQNYPNPFNPTTTISYSIDKSSLISMTVFTITGQRVKQLVNARQQQGVYSVDWNGLDDRGQTVGSGFYLAVLRAGDQQKVIKMNLVK